MWSKSVLPGWQEDMSVFIFEELGSLRVVLRADWTKRLRGRVVSSGESNASDIRGDQDRHVSCGRGR